MTHNGEKERLSKKAADFGVAFNGEQFDRTAMAIGLVRTVIMADAVLDKYQHVAYKAQLAQEAL